MLLTVHTAITKNSSINQVQQLYIWHLRNKVHMYICSIAICKPYGPGIGLGLSTYQIHVVCMGPAARENRGVLFCMAVMVVCLVTHVSYPPRNLEYTWYYVVSSKQTQQSTAVAHDHFVFLFITFALQPNS